MELADEKTGVSGHVVAAVILIIVIAGGATGGLFYYFKTGSNPIHGLSQTTGNTSSVGLPSGSQLATAGYNVQVTKVVLDQLAGMAGEYILDVDASYSGGGTWTVQPPGLRAC